MKTSNILIGVVLSTALAWGGVEFGRRNQSKPAETAPAARPAVAGAPAPETAHEVPAKADAAVVAATKPENGPAAPVVSVSDSAEAAEPAAVEFEKADVLAATQQGIVEATLTGNGRERMSARLRNNSPTPLRVTVPAGQVLEGGRSRVIVTRAAEVELMPARGAEIDLTVAALNSSNIVVETAFRLSYHEEGRLEAFLKWAADHGEVSGAAVQTAVLALTENLPLSAVAKFAPVNGAAGILNTDAFRVETGDILAALSALRDSGANMESVAMNTDPQLRIEAMIEPLSREAAKRYYGITEEREWDFWKRELLEGSPSTRHYALFGIARFYPDVALEMLPKWARETQTHAVYRSAAVQALADTQRPAALPLLRQIAEEVGPQTDLGKAAVQAANYLDKRLTETASRPQVAAFRAKSTVNAF
ncbi:MAG: hypothetical protein ABMA01_03645 [Chthoniobacteraceae bacterium]